MRLLLMVLEARPLVDWSHLLGLITIKPEILCNVWETARVLNWFAEWLVLHSVEFDCGRSCLHRSRRRWIEQRRHIVNWSVGRVPLLQKVCG